MAARYSTGLVNNLMAARSFSALFANCFIDIYSGAQPATADTAASGTKLCTLYSDGVSAGVNLEKAATAGGLQKAVAEAWTGTVLATGTAGWFRIRAAQDPGTAAAGAAVTGAARTAGNAEATFTTGVAHGAVAGDTVVITGFTPAAYNGTYTVQSAPLTTTFVVVLDSISVAGDTTSVQGTYTKSTPTADAGTTTSTTAIRVDGSIATSGAQMNLGSLTLTAGAPFVVANATITQPQA